jgi:hypothetical protein
MTPDQMLDELHSEGISAESDFNDNLLGWFGWEVDKNNTRLTITFEAAGGAKHTGMWTLVKES